MPKVYCVCPCQHVEDSNGQTKTIEPIYEDRYWSSAESIEQIENLSLELATDDASLLINAEMPYWSEFELYRDTNTEAYFLIKA
jgi:hypothetical protein